VNYGFPMPLGGWSLYSEDRSATRPHLIRRSITVPEPIISEQEQLKQRLLVLLNPRRTTKQENLLLLTGSGTTVPTVPGVDKVMLLVDEFTQANNYQPQSTEQFRAIVRSSGTKADKYGRYRELIDRMQGVGTFDQIIQHAVRRAYNAGSDSDLAALLADDPWLDLSDYAEDMEKRIDAWSIPAGLEALAEIVAEHRDKFAPTILTTNFDPLIEIALRRHGVNVRSVNLSTDGSMAAAATERDTITVIHLHGFWRFPGSLPAHPNLHSDIELSEGRRIIESDLMKALTKHIALIIGYSGWDDSFTRAMVGQSNQGFRELLWAAHTTDPDVIGELRALTAGKNGVTNNRVFAGIDANLLFPSLLVTLKSSATADVAEVVEAFSPSLTDPAALDERFGHKVVTLARLAQAGVRVPAGIALELPQDSAFINSTAHRAWDAIESNGVFASPPPPMIVRSSASVEDQPDALFPGIFVSARDITSKDSLIAGVDKCHKSLSAPALASYLKLRERRPEELRMSVLIQEQVEAEFSGVAFTRPPAPFEHTTLMIEMVAGASSELLEGRVAGSMYAFGDSPGSPRSPVHLSGVPLELSKVAAVLQGVWAAAEQIKNVLSTEALDIEWVWNGDHLYVVQVRKVPAMPELDLFTPEPPAPTVSARGNLPLPAIEIWGHKGAAAKYFDTDLIGGAANATFIMPKATLAEVKKALAERRTSPDGTTIRYSHETKLSLPRTFITADEDIAAAYFKLRTDPEWFGIISDFVYFRHSFEAYIGKDDLLVEHVPGNWETDNVLPPDLFLWTGGRGIFLRVSQPRQAQLQVPGDVETSHPIVESTLPLESSQAEAFVRTFLPKLRKIKHNFPDHLPLNVHFTADREGRLYFLNIRPTDALDVANVSANPNARFRINRLYRVADFADLQNWDGKTPILISATEDRSRFAKFIDVANGLRARGVTEVHCTFGILSHPAILLREVGIRVLPLLLTHEYVQIDMGSW